MDIRKLIREEVEKVFQEQDADNSVLGGAIQDIGAMLQVSIDNTNKLIDAQKISLKNDEFIFKKDNEKKSSISSKIGDVDNPEKKGLQIMLPLKKKLNQFREKNIQDLQKGQEVTAAAQKEIENLKKKSAQTTSKSSSTGQKAIQSVLPSLQSPI